MKVNTIKKTKVQEEEYQFRTNSLLKIIQKSNQLHSLLWDWTCTRFPNNFLGRFYLIKNKFREAPKVTV